MAGQTTRNATRASRSTRTLWVASGSGFEVDLASQKCQSAQVSLDFMNERRGRADTLRLLAGRR